MPHARAAAFAARRSSRARARPRLSMAQRNALAGAAFGSLAAVVWGAWPVVSRLGVLEPDDGAAALSAWDIAAVRFAVAGAARLPRREAPVPTRG